MLKCVINMYLSVISFLFCIIKLKKLIDHKTEEISLTYPIAKERDMTCSFLIWKT